MSDDWLTEDPFADPQDPAAREREERRREREERRAKRAGKAAAAESKKAPPPPPPQAPEPPAEPPPLPRTPEQEFWNEEPTPEPPAPIATEPTLHDEGDPDMAAAARSGRRAGDGGGNRGRGVLGAIGRHPFRLVAVLFALLVLLFLNSFFQPFHGDGSGRVQVTIPKGSSVSEVGDILEEKGVIDGGLLISGSTMFQARVTLAGKRSEIYSGHFTLAEGMSYGAAIDALSTPPVKRTVAVTIPEGYTRSQAAQLVEEDGIPGSYTKATVRSKYLDPAQYGGKGAKDLEGFLFPDTFELKPNAPVADLVQLQLQDFKRRIKGVDMGYAKSKNLTVYDVLIIASMVEREAGVQSQYKDVASVIYNRLHEGMPLGIDATIRFATGNYTKPLTESELAVDSPYNTRTNAGLPPGPIDSPGLAAIEAAAHPAKTGYIFYVTKPGACGKLTFAKTEAEFEKAVSEYNTAREEAGGNSPDTCGE
ncbi:MAG TPA: endolytic transglycosylase MltG [Solirubrobacterales bacterium]|nr:endolytic transglycosylase MltG [Solirubrobacterales bacterium]